jgi:CBS domain-containing protein
VDSGYLEEVVPVSSLGEIVDASLNPPSLKLVFAVGGEPLPLTSLFKRPGRGQPVVVLASKPGLGRALRELVRGRYVVVKGEMKAATYRSVFLHLARAGRVRLSLSLQRLAGYPSATVAPNTSVKRAVALLGENCSVALGVRVRGRISRILTAVDFLNYALENGYGEREILLDDAPVSRVKPLVVGEPGGLPRDTLESLRRYALAVIPGEREALVDESSLRRYLKARAAGSEL